MRLRTVDVGDAPDLSRAAMRLDVALAMVDAERHGGGLRMRFEVRVENVDPLGWLAAWDGPGSYWASRDGILTVAGRGEAVAVGGPRSGLHDGLDAIADLVRGGGPRVRAFGGVAFFEDFGTEGGPWERFGGFRFALPAVEVGRDAQGGWMALQLVAEEAAVAEQIVALRALLHQPCVRPPLRPLPSLRSRTQVPSRADFDDAIAASLAAIAGGSVDKVVLARRVDLRFDGEVSAIDLLEGVATRDPSSFRFCIRPEVGVAFVGASPERLFRRDGLLVASEAIAGTRPRGANDAEDAALADELHGAAKDRHEHALVVAAVRDALSNLCEAVEAAPGPILLRLALVQHLHTPVRGRLRRSVRDADLIEALHPTPAVCGTPRDVARAMIAQVERFERGLYAAPVGWIGDDAAEIAVAIRSALVEGSNVSLFSGAGIVQASEADAEWSEIEGKIRSPLEVLGVVASAADRGESP